MSLDFKILATDANARLGRIRLPRATVSTPAFMPVGTQATVKGVFIEDLIKTCLLYTSPSPRDRG